MRSAALRSTAAALAGLGLIAGCTASPNPPSSSQHVAAESNQSSEDQGHGTQPGCAQPRRWRAVTSTRVDLLAATVVGNCTLVMVESYLGPGGRTSVRTVTVDGKVRRVANLRRIHRVGAVATAGRYVWAGGSEGHGRSVVYRIDPSSGASRSVRLPGHVPYVLDMSPYGHGVLVLGSARNGTRVFLETAGGAVRVVARMPTRVFDALASTADGFVAVAGAKHDAGWLAFGRGSGELTLRRLPRSIEFPSDVLVDTGQVVVSGRILSQGVTTSSSIVASSDAGKHWRDVTPAGTRHGDPSEIGAAQGRLFAVATRGQHSYLFVRSLHGSGWSTLGPEPLPESGSVLPTRYGVWVVGGLHAYWMSYPT